MMTSSIHHLTENNIRLSNIYQTNGRRLCEACNSSNIIVNKTKTINKLNQLQTKLCRRPFWKYPDDTLYFLSRRKKNSYKTIRERGAFGYDFIPSAQDSGSNISIITL